MNCLFYVSSSAAVLSKSRHFVTRTPSFGLYSPSLWKRTLVLGIAGVKCANLDSVLTRFRVQCFSTARRGRKAASPSRKPEGESAVMEEDKNAFYVVRKGDLVGVYKSLSECQAQVGSSVCDPSVSVFKGHSLPEEAADYLTARGLQNALYCIGAADLNEDLFGTLVPCPFQEPGSLKGGREGSCFH
ncbi:hypothetical protein Scep_017718 [Stephania cephalantha]|uniref:Ribonuclease H1 N-terminal domain-containing protein n=1 Tax=Stephania cephalantha TaxID=152367 RepID=A0AAP0IQZ3_9MAGN